MKIQEELKDNKAITLVALVVTIIVLIILAGVSISLVLGDNGIVAKAKEAKQNMQVAANDEQASLANLTVAIGEDINENEGGTTPEGPEVPADLTHSWLEMALITSSIFEEVHGELGGTLWQDVSMYIEYVRSVEQNPDRYSDSEKAAMAEQLINQIVRFNNDNNDDVDVNGKRGILYEILNAAEMIEMEYFSYVDPEVFEEFLRVTEEAQEVVNDIEADNDMVRMATSYLILAWSNLYKV